MSDDARLTALPKRNRRAKYSAASALKPALKPARTIRRASAPVSPPIQLPYDQHSITDDYFSPKPASHSVLETPDGVYFPRPHPTALVLQIKRLLQTHKLYVQSFLDIDNLIACFDRDEMESANRRSVRTSIRATDDSDLAVFGVSLREVVMYASNTVPFGDCQNDVPIVVTACVQELCQRDLRTDPMFEAIADRDALFSLITQFDSHPTFGKKVILEHAKVETIISLLVTFVSGLPEPVVSPKILDALWEWCICPCLAQNSQKDRRHLIDQVSATNPQSSNALEQSTMLVAKALLLLLPSPNFSLFVYLMCFFKQVSTSGIPVQNFGVKFGNALLGARKPPGEKADSRGPIVLAWLLSRWKTVSDDILSSSTMTERVTSQRKPCSRPSEQLTAPCHVPVSKSLSVVSKVDDEPPVIPQISLGRDVVVLEPTEGLFGDNKLSDIAERPSQLSDSDTTDYGSCSSEWSNEDTTPRVPGKNNPPGLGRHVDENEFDDSLHSSHKSSDDSLDKILLAAQFQILELENQLDKCDRVMTDALEETFEERRRADALAQQVRSFERKEDKRSQLLFAYGVGSSDDHEVLVMRLEDALLEKDNAIREKEVALQQLEKFKSLLNIEST